MGLDDMENATVATLPELPEVLHSGTSVGRFGCRRHSAYSREVSFGGVPDDLTPYNYELYSICTSCGGWVKKEGNVLPRDRERGRDLPDAESVLAPEAVGERKEIINQFVQRIKTHVVERDYGSSTLFDLRFSDVEKEAKKFLSSTSAGEAEKLRHIANAALRFCEELQEDADGVPQDELKELNQALDALQVRISVGLKERE